MVEAVGGIGRGGDKIAEIGMERIVAERYENIRAKAGSRVALGVVFE
jgi:hypothetical protein